MSQSVGLDKDIEPVHKDMQKVVLNPNVSVHFIPKTLNKFNYRILFCIALGMQTINILIQIRRVKYTRYGV
jgi:hypothetical protein